MSDKEFLQKLKDKKIYWGHDDMQHIKKLKQKGLVTYMSEDYNGGWWELTPEGRALIS